jgi:hypothetical protein
LSDYYSLLQNCFMNKLPGYLLAAFIAFAGTHASAQIITTIAGNGAFSFSGDGGPATAAALSGPHDIFPTPGGLYIADQWNNRIRFVNSVGTISTIAGNGTTAWAGEGIPATTAGLSFPRGVCTDAAGNVLIADEGNERIRKVTPGGLIYNYAGNGTGAYSGDGGPATSACIHDPMAVCTDAAGNLYIADEMNSVVRKVTPAGIISTFAGTGTAGHSGDGGPATSANFQSPMGLCFDAAGNMYVSDYWWIRKITPAGIVSTIAGNGTLGYTGDGGPATSASFDNAKGICVDAAGNVYFSDQNNHRVRKITPAGIISTYAGTGVFGFSGDGGAPGAAQLNMPTGLRMDVAGSIYIGDYGNNRVRKIWSATAAIGNTGAATVVVNAYPNPASSNITIECQQPVNAQIMSLDGRVLLKEDNTTKIDISSLATGNYLLVVFDPATGARLYNKVITRE